MRSFDASRERSAPSTLVGTTNDGGGWSLDVRRMTLVVAVKPHCDGCRSFLESDLAEFANVEVVFVAAATDEEYRVSSHDVVVAPSLMVELEIRAAPFYVLIDPSVSRVVAEGTLFNTIQVASEIASFVTSKPDQM